MNPDKYAELFATEAREHLSQISQALVVLEAAPQDRDSLDAIFRCVHTIKGMAAAMGYEAAAALSHSIESALDAVRSGRRSINADLIDLLLGSGDALEEAVEAAVAGRDAADHSEWLALLERASGLTDRPPHAVAETHDVSSADKGRERVAPLSASRSRAGRVRVDISRLDALMNLLGELLIVRSRLDTLAADLGSEPLQDAIQRLELLISEMQGHVIASRMVPVWQVFDRFPRVVRDVARLLGKEVEIEVSGKELELDRSMLDAISDPLVHLLRNAVDHGIETPEEREKAGKPRKGTIRLSARRERSHVIIRIADDGRGVDRARVLSRARQLGMISDDVEPDANELFRLMAHPGFSTKETVSQVSGRGVGLDVVEEFVKSFGGSIRFKTESGVGSTLELELPLTLAIVRALIVEVSGQEYAFPITFTRASFESPAEDVEVAHGREWVRWRDERLPVTRLQRLFANEKGVGERGGEPAASVLKMVTVEFGGERRAVCVDRFIGEEEIVVKTFDPPLGALPIFSGATVRSNGKPALIVDVARLS